VFCFELVMPLFDKSRKLVYLIAKLGIRERWIILFKFSINTVLAMVVSCGVLPACAPLKEAGRTIGHTTRDVTTEIGHGARDITTEIGHGTRDVVREIGEGTRDATNAAAEEVKKVVKPAPSEY